MAGRGRGLRQKWERRETKQDDLQFLALNRKLPDICKCFFCLYLLHCIPGVVYK